MIKKEAPGKKGKLKTLKISRQTVQDLSPGKSAAQKIKGGFTVRAGYDGGGYGVMQSGSGGC